MSVVCTSTSEYILKSVFGASELILATLLVASYHAPVWLLVLLLNNVSKADVNVASVYTPGGIVSVQFDEFTPKLILSLTFFFDS